MYLLLLKFRTLELLWVQYGWGNTDKIFSAVYHCPSRNSLSGKFKVAAGRLVVNIIKATT
jgi:hypothetical protein